MKYLAQFFLERQVLVKIIIISIVVLGLKAIISLPKEGFPQVALNKAVITTIYPGASSVDVESNITIKIEEELEGISGIDEVISVSKEGISIITISGDEDKSEDYFNFVFQEISQALDRVDDLPEGIKGKPTIEKINTFDVPIVQLAFTGEYKKLKDFLPFIERILLRHKNISGVDKVGLPDEEVHVIVDADAAKNKYVDLKMIALALNNRNVEGTGGTLTINSKEKRVIISNKYKNFEEILNTNIRTNEEGLGVKLKEVAKVERVPEDLKLSVRNNGMSGASLLIKKKDDADIIKTIHEIKKEISKIKIPDGIELRYLDDQSTFTNSRINMMVVNAIIGVLLVAGILLLIFDFKMAFWVSFGIPFALLMAYAVFPFLGLTLNAISLGGFIIMVGCVVDDAIVISERIRKNQESGMDPSRSCIDAVVDLWKPVTASTLTTILSFSPLFAFGGLPGKFIWVMPIIVILVLLSSLFECFFILPSHLLSKSKKKKKINLDFLQKLGDSYAKTLRFALKFRYIMIAVFAILLIGCAVYAKLFIPKDAFPQDAAEGIHVTVTLPLEITEADANKRIHEIEEIIAPAMGKSLIGHTSRIGTHSSDVKTDRGTQYNLAKIFIYLKPFTERKVSVFTLIDKLRKSSSKFDDVKFSFDVQRVGPDMGNDFEVDIAAYDDDIRLAKMNEVETYIKTLKGVTDLENDNIIGNEEYKIEINYDVLSSVGLSVNDLLTTLKVAFDGMIITDNVERQGTIDYRLRLNQKFRSSVNFINRLPILNSKGMMIDIGKMVTIKKQISKAEIIHLDGVRSTKVYGSVDKTVTSGTAIINSVKKKFPSSRDIHITFAGQPVEQAKIFGDAGIAALVAFIGIYLVLALVFNSFKIPFVVMSAIPFLLIGVIGSVGLHGIPISMFISMALISLMGIVVNDSIVMIDTFIKHKTKFSKITKEEIITLSGSRLRPILLTTITTTLGLFPTAYGLGGYDIFISPMCLAMAWGLLFATLVILFFIPAIYSILEAES